MADVRLSESPLLILPVALIALAAAGAAAHARVVAASPDGFVSEHEILLDATPDAAYVALTEGIHNWWDGDHSYSGNAANFYLEARANGCFCETLPDGGSVMHMQVVFAQPGRLLRLTGGLGPLQGMGVSGAMDFALEPAEQGSRLRYRYVVHGFVPDGLEALAPVVDQVQLGQLERLRRYLADH